MITALISGLFGAFNALLPDVVSFFKRRQEMQERREERAHEIKMIEVTTNAQVTLGQQKIEEARVAGEMTAVQTQLSGFYEQLKSIYEAQKPIGVKWVDAWNAALRPAAVSVILLVFAIGILIYEVSVLYLWWQGSIPSGDIVEAMFKGLVGEAIQAVMGYLFGYRGTNAARRYCARH